VLSPFGSHRCALRRFPLQSLSQEFPMKIEIDLNDVFRDEDGNPDESLEESVRRQVVDRLSGDLRKRLFARLDEQLSAIMTEQLGIAVKEQMPALVDDIMNVNYTPVSTYGQRGEPTTFRDEIIKSISSNMKYEPKNYSSDENAFTRAVKSIVELKTNEIKKALAAEIDVKFQKDAISYAVTEMSKRLGLIK
jgi:hypothetical protein